MIAIEASKEALWLKGLVGDIGISLKDFIVYYDNQSAIHLTKNQMHHERVKYIDIRMYFIRDVTTRGDVLLRKIATSNNSTNMMTKERPLMKFKHCFDIVGIHKCQLELEASGQMKVNITKCCLWK